MLWYSDCCAVLLISTASQCLMLGCNINTQMLFANLTKKPGFNFILKSLQINTAVHLKITSFTFLRQGFLKRVCNFCHYNYQCSDFYHILSKLHKYSPSKKIFSNFADFWLGFFSVSGTRFRMHHLAAVDQWNGITGQKIPLNETNCIIFSLARNLGSNIFD